MWTGSVGEQSLFKWQFFSVGEYSNEQQVASSLHLMEHPKISVSIDGLLPIWPTPGISPGWSLYPSGQANFSVVKLLQN